MFNFSDLMVVEKNVKTKTKLFTNEWHSHLPQGLQYPLKWTEPAKIQSCLVYRQKSITTVDNRGRDPAASLAKQRRQKVLVGWIGNRWKYVASILSLLVVL